MMKHYILDADHNPVQCNEVMVWGRFFEDMDNRRVAYSETEFHTVSTVFLGIDHNFGDGPPILFESMVFERQETLKKFFGEDKYVQEELDCDRYRTWDEAKAGHAKLVMQIIRNEQNAMAEFNKWMAREQAEPKS